MNARFRTLFLALAIVLAAVAPAHALVVDFSGGTAYLSDGSAVTTSDTMTPLYYSDVDYYVEDGIKVDFVGGYGIIGRYYDAFSHPEIQNSVIHAHWGPLQSVVFTKVDGTSMDLNYMDLSSNTVIGGYQADGTELSYVTTSGGYSMLLPSSDWGITYLSDGVTAGDGIERLWLDGNFDGISSFTVTSLNAYCFGLDNFYIDEAAPPNPVPEPGTMLLLGSGLFGLAGYGRRKLRR